MNALDFTAKQHLSSRDQDRLARVAAANGQTQEDYVELALKKALFSGPSLASSPTPAAPKKEGGQ